MPRRRTVALASATALLALCVLTVGMVVGVTRSRPGQDWVRRTILDVLAPRVRGSLYVGRISGNFLSGVTVDSLVIRGPDDSLFVAASRIRVAYDVRDLIDRRVLLRRVEIDRPVIRLSQAEDGVWNYKRVFASGGPSGPKTGRGFGDYIVADSVVVRGGTFVLTMPWHVADTLRGARRDSAIVRNLARTDAEIRRRGRDFTRTWRWTNGNVALAYARLADPDTAGRRFVVARLDADETDPPFRWRNIRGDVRWLGDSIWADVPHWDLAGSTGTGRAKIVWGSNLPMRYDVRVVGDSVSLRDVAWVYPTLPRTGGGRLTLTIRNDPRNLRIIDYGLSDMDVRTTRSRLRGAMTYAVGGPVLGVKNVDVRAEPLDFDLIRALNGKPFPYDWQGALTGTVKARGGPLNRFVVDDARFTFADRNVPGAVTRGTARGGLDILFPAFTRFHALRVDVAQLDLRTLTYLNASFPRIGGLIAGRATLDSSWLDVRFRDADVTHTDGPAPASRFTGDGRVTFGTQFMSYALNLQAQPLSLDALARSYPLLPVRGLLAGPLRATGTVDALRVTTSLTGAAGTLRFDGTIDAYEPSYGATGAVGVAQLDLRALLGDPRLPATSITANGTVNAVGSGPADLAGALQLTLDRSIVDGTRLYGGAARLGFSDGRLRLDTLDVVSTAARLTASGGLGLTSTRTDSLRIRIVADSLGGLRRWLLANSTGADPSGADSLSGTLRVEGVLAGTIDTTRGSPGLALEARLEGEALAYGRTRAALVDARVSGQDLLRAATLSLTASGDSLLVGGLALTRAEGRLTLDSLRADSPGALRVGTWSMRAGSDSGAALAAVGRAQLATESTLVLVDSARLAVAAGREYALAAPARLLTRRAGNAMVLDSLVLRDGAGARIAVAAQLQDTGTVFGALTLDGVPIADLARVSGRVGASDATAATTAPVASYGGRLTFGARLAGTRAQPLVTLRADARDATLAGVAVERVTADGSYAARRMVANLGLFRDGAQLLTANAALPIDLALVPGTRRLPDDTLQGAVRADSLDLALFGAVVPGLRDVAGRMRIGLELGGTWERPRLFGALRLDDGAATVAPAGIRLQALAADVALEGDSVALRRVFARSGGAGDTLALTGFVRLTSISNPTFGLRLAARNFLAIDRPRLATLWISTPEPVSVTGPYLAAVVRGAVRAERGRIYIPELIDKRIVDLNEYRDVVDTTVGQNRRLIPAPSAFVENLRLDDVRLEVGDDVWLRSPEANIKLGGTLAVTRAVARGGSFAGAGRDQAQLALLGALGVTRGTYRLNLGFSQPIFEVEPGTLRFFGTPDLNPTLDVRAVHVVRQVRSGTNRPDVRVQVNIGGTLNQPTLRLSSADNPPIPDTDLISYLVTGEPASAVLGQTQGREQGAALALRLAGSLLSGALTQGGPFDVVQVQTAGLSGDATGFLRSSGDILSRTRLGFGGQLGRRTFYTFTTGLCGLNSPTEAGSLALFANGLGFKIERRLTPTLSVELGLEPGSVQQACLRGTSTRSYQQTPTQGGIDFFRRWSF
ncbi:MAG: translocation/assembly module TamB domain-containing protein [Gemmatirosa sp.]